MCFNAIARNHDDHTKNISFLMDPQGEWHLSPAYDVTFAYNPQGEWTQQHLMSVNGKFVGIAKADLFNVAARFSVADAEKTIKQVRDAVREWRGFATQAGVQDAEIARIGGLQLSGV